MQRNSIWFKVLILNLLLLSGCNKTNRAPVEIQETKGASISQRKYSGKHQSEIKVSEKIEKVKEIAILVPLHGEGAQLGREMSDLIKNGIQDSGYKKQINISVYDSSSSQAMHESIKDIASKETDLILGVPSSKLVSPIHTFTNSKIPIVTLSNNINLNLDNVYIFGHKPMKQTEKILSYMIQNDISKDIILLLPESNNNTLAKVLESKINSMGGRCVLIKHYQDMESISSTISTVNEFVHKFNENPAHLKKLGIYVADSKKNLDKMFDLVKKLHLDKTANIFGDNRLDISNAHDMNSFYIGYSNNGKNNFDNYDYIHKLAYDLGLYAGHALQNENITNYLNNSDWIEGASGYFKAQNQATNRKYEVLKRANGKVKVLEGID